MEGLNQRLLDYPRMRLDSIQRIMLQPPATKEPPPNKARTPSAAR